MKKRPNECLFCSSRKCHEHIYSGNDNGATYNEIACMKHRKDLHRHSERTAPGVMRVFVSSTGLLNRRCTTDGKELER